VIAAAPKYLGTTFDSAPPGHRFSLYFPAWEKDDKDNLIFQEKRKAESIKEILSIPTESRKQVDAIRNRQVAILSALPEASRLRFDALSTSPLVTGMGMEHPLENGFAFLNPYGIPYLPGSSVKGVLRSAAEQLIESGDTEWTADLLCELFGSEDEKSPKRGALVFWDVIPDLAGHTLAVDVMTPHYGNYYQGKESPHDAGQPNPIFFMVIPPESHFTFYISCDDGLATDISWKALMESAYSHALDWLGFGAKTSVGYGQLKRLSAEDSEQRVRRQQQESVRCSWVDDQIAEICRMHRIPAGKEKDALLGKPLAEAWQSLDNPELKHIAWLDIVSRWKDEKIGAPWDAERKSGSQKAAHAIYKTHEKQEQ
jgi:CRISPR-associated protein Cmr6